MSSPPARSDAETPVDVFDAARAAQVLDATLRGPQFRNSQRQAALLRYLVTEECEGRGERLSAYAIAFDVFERDTSFNPAIDSIVRVEMHRLRGNLQAWGEDPANAESLMLEIRPRSYRPSLVERVPPARGGLAGQLAQRRRLIGLTLAGVGALALVLAVVQGSRVRACKSARPELFLPQSVPGLSAAAADDLVTRLRGMLHYYPLVAIAEGWFGRCQGVPQYDLGLARNPNGISASLMVRGEERIVRTFDVPFDPASSARDHDIAAAQIAFQLGHDAGAVPLDALRQTWTNAPAAEQFSCLMRAHQYYISNAGVTLYPSARACLIKYFRSATKADLPAMLAAFELEPIMTPAQKKYQTHNYYNEAVAAASKIDRLNSELLVVQLREMRLDPKRRRGDIQVVLDEMSNVYEFEPYVQNQLAMARCKSTQEYAAGYENIKLARALTFDGIGLPYAEVYCNLALDRNQDNAKFNEALVNDRAPFVQLLVL
ncbi:MAG: hypothetical protein KGM49_05455 [Sphingomonadales bacterium]|nr:hypothetical protein [Sphingomonadales bacterium]